MTVEAAVERFDPHELGSRDGPELAGGRCPERGQPPFGADDSSNQQLEFSLDNVSPHSSPPAQADRYSQRAPEMDKG